jgi:hypothetical protein
VTRHDNVTMLAGEEAAPGGEREETTSVGLTQIEPKMIKIHAANSAAINGR